jgi:5-methylcytosine-specific restriction endonuclease McrA
MTFTKKQIDTVWNLAQKVRGQDPDKVRQDPYGNRMNRDSYGKTTATGWEVDHIIPSARGGSDATRNLQALKASVNRAKSDSLVKKSRHSK